MITNGADPDDKPRSMASHLGLASLPLSVPKGAKHLWINKASPN